MSGPLPDPRRRRRNAPTIPTTELPASGRRGAAPKSPAGYNFEDAAAAWWRWAWKLPQACGWSSGDLYVVARRAQLEDLAAALDLVDGFDLAELLAVGDDYREMARRLEMVIGRLKGLAGGRLALEREMRELDDRLGLTPKGLAGLRWTIVDDSADTGQAPVAEGVTQLDDRRRRLTADAS